MPRSAERVSWREVVRVLQHDEARSLVMRLFNDSGYGPDDFASKPAARRSLADALSKAEDMLETLGGGARAHRLEVQAIRRRLEREMWT